ncbi:conserved hypothetical protein [Theileria orientalis strain Shintoku]|uniref:Uncharacterized protein n=1 Tax=Theileria orientalis strain Shintoku TaxID=869250 RepID=J4C841_THEOR|nr:conserved hypothetical protein [Theileria orientalis strain Shintoku]BAM40128.1 conserved hypothetical protein [Theileria orientalis strain Shintoku]|eukprot:XP_009690429.1 conserved hypothetical protein [Theileria orientalis strain Shintoku]
MSTYRCSLIIFLDSFLNILLLDIDFFVLLVFKHKPCNFSFVQSLRINKISLNRSIINSLDHCCTNRSDSTHTLSSLEKPKFNNCRIGRNQYSFIRYNTLNTYKTFKPPKYDKTQNGNLIHIDKTRVESMIPYSQTSLYLFRTIKDFFKGPFTGWYVPPIPVGEKVSYMLRGKEPLQTDEQTEEFLSKIGATDSDDIFEVMAKYREQIKSSPSYVRRYLISSCQEYLRKYFVRVFEEVEDVASRGTDAWREFWKPEKDETGRFTESDSLELTEKDREFASWFSPKLKIEESIMDAKRRQRAFLRIDKNKYIGLVRLTRDPKGRLIRCLKSMVPVMAAGLLPKLGKLSITISSMMACRIIYKGDEKEKSEKNWDPSRYVTPGDLDGSETSKSLVTLALVAGHSALGYLMASVANLGSTLVVDAIYAFFINTQLILSALLYDTSQMSFKEITEIGKKREDDHESKIDLDED